MITYAPCRNDIARLHHMNQLGLTQSYTRDYQIGGTHYGNPEDIQPWDVVDNWGLNYYAGNILKYLKRYRLKGTPIQDLEKARHHLDKLIEITRQEVDVQPPPT